MAVSASLVSLHNLFLSRDYECVASLSGQKVQPIWMHDARVRLFASQHNPSFSIPLVFILQPQIFIMALIFNILRYGYGLDEEIYLLCLLIILLLVPMQLLTG